MIRIAICDDDRIALGAIRGAIEKALGDHGLQPEISEYYSPVALKKAMKENVFDLLMLDIDMPEINGIDFGRMLRRENNDTDIIFISNCENRVFDAMQIQPKGFIRKSHFFADLDNYARILSRQYAHQETPSVIIETRDGAISLPIRQIIYVESSLKNQVFHVEGSDKTFIQKQSMKKVAETLGTRGFIRIHASYLVNFRFISVFRQHDVLLTDGTALPLSRSNAAEAKQSYLAIMAEQGNIML